MSDRPPEREAAVARFIKTAMALHTFKEEERAYDDACREATYPLAQAVQEWRRAGCPTCPDLPPTVRDILNAVIVWKKFSKTTREFDRRYMPILMPFLKALDALAEVTVGTCPSGPTRGTGE